MKRVFLTLLAAFVFPLLSLRAEEVEPVAVPAPVSTAPKVVVVIPMREGIDKPILYVLRRGLKEAIEKKADVVVLDMETPGGRLDVTFEIMEALEKFEGETITFVNKEAISAGAFISATTKEIWFAPHGIIGAAAAVSSGGEDIQETMQLKINSFLRAKVRAMSEGHPYRGAAVSAMLDKDYELKIGEEVLKPKGELLSLTATEASKTYGQPPQPLLAAGIAKTVDDLLVQKFGAGNFTAQTLKVTWSEELATYLNAWSPILMGLGLLAIFIEFKTPGFGFFGITGGVLLGIVFFGHYAAGLSGHEPVLVFVLGVLLVLAEILLFPGVIVAALTGLILMLGALVWSMADLWPNEPIDFNSDVFVRPFANLGIGVVIAVVLAVVLARFLPRGWFLDRLILQPASGAIVHTPADRSSRSDTLIGRTGVVMTPLLPSGQVEIDGRRYEALVAVGSVDVGDTVVVRGQSDFNLIVEKA
ncbi:MAG: nodulation protein NfeD [Rariglobus sp.]|nr:NfeD family protein [Rariglobus sp.]